MSQNIENVLTLSCSLIVHSDGSGRALACLPSADELPERHPVPLFIGTTCVVLDGIQWSGTWSGRSFFDGTFARFCACTTGAAELVFVWEGGDVEGVRIENGTFTRHRLRYDFGDEID